MKSAAAPFPGLTESPPSAGAPSPLPTSSEQRAFKRQLVARMIAEGAEELAHMTALVHLSELVHQDVDPKG